MGKLNPKYNTLKIAGSSSGHKLSEETKAKISKSLKGVYINEKSSLFDRTHTEETKAPYVFNKNRVKGVKLILKKLKS